MHNTSPFNLRLQRNLATWLYILSPFIHSSTHCDIQALYKYRTFPALARFHAALPAPLRASSLHSLIPLAIAIVSCTARLSTRPPVCLLCIMHFRPLWLYSDGPSPCTIARNCIHCFGFAQLPMALLRSV